MTNYYVNKLNTYQSIPDILSILVCLFESFLQLHIFLSILIKVQAGYKIQPL